ncbi:flagellar hook-length control protein FliK [Chelativorans sp. J32]|uniref:flagellar hook-length control protein FliK n=1 Tax=Chelativorans sp. J32 TaxID=935840 RepID=UPI0004892585|nr:flagellar hook-length control protein FliK [Chelativorans sp. J32]
MTDAIKPGMAASSTRPEIGHERKAFRKTDAFADALRDKAPQDAPENGKRTVLPQSRHGWHLADRVLEISLPWNRTVAKESDGAAGKNEETDPLAAIPIQPANVPEQVLIQRAESASEAAPGPKDDLLAPPSLPADTTHIRQPNRHFVVGGASPDGMQRNEQPAIERLEIRTEPAPSERSHLSSVRESIISSRGGAVQAGLSPGDDGQHAQPSSKDSIASSLAMRVVSTQNIPAPTPPPAAGDSITATVLASLKADSGFRTAAAEAAVAIAQGSARTNQPLHTLNIQLHPAELGTVTARLSISGEQLTVEIHVESAEARHKLQSDRDGMVQTLRSLGYDVDRITIQQAPNNTSAHAGSGGAGRDPSFQAGSGQGQERSPNHPRGDAGGNPFAGSGEAIERRQDAAAGNGLYI